MSTAKQRFYENHSGSSVAEINRITATILIGHVLYVLLARIGFVRSRIDQFSWGFVCYVFNVLLATTVYSNMHGQLLLLYTTAVITVLLYDLYHPQPVEKSKVQEPRPGNSKTKRVAYISVYRATMMITTVLSILAVDLPIFPRRYAKSETWGTSLMDLGVGSFVFSSGIVSSTQRLGLLASLRQGGIILAMGVARAVMVRGTGYHEHASEYGAHWNFFITLSLLPPLIPVFRKLQKRGIPFLVQGVAVCLIYQVLLVKTHWQTWIIGAYRDNLLSANKEGVSSFVGYISIFLLGLDAGTLILSKRQLPVLTLLSFTAISFISAYLFATRFANIRVSRRIANAPYILWVAAHNASFILALALIEKGFFMLNARRSSKKTSEDSFKVPLLLEKVNSQGLYVFLGSNLLTGAINLAMGDAMMTTSATVGLAIMLTYGAIVSAAAFCI